MVKAYSHMRIPNCGRILDTSLQSSIVTIWRAHCTYPC